VTARTASRLLGLLPAAGALLMVSVLAIPLLALVVSTGAGDFFGGLRHPLALSALRLSLLTTTSSLALTLLLERPAAKAVALDASLAALRSDPAHAVASSEEAPDEIAAVQQRRALVRSALGALSEAQRATLELAYYGGLSHTEIAEQLGEPLGTVKTRIRQTLLALRQSLGARLT